jgi:hypothetical protein
MRAVSAYAGSLRNRSEHWLLLRNVRSHAMLRLMVREPITTNVDHIARWTKSIALPSYKRSQWPRILTMPSGRSLSCNRREPAGSRFHAPSGGFRLSLPARHDWIDCSHRGDRHGIAAARATVVLPVTQAGPWPELPDSRPAAVMPGAVCAGRTPHHDAANKAIAFVTRRKEGRDIRSSIAWMFSAMGP